jgi:hypothetical protein
MARQNNCQSVFATGRENEPPLCGLANNLVFSNLGTVLGSICILLSALLCGCNSDFSLESSETDTASFVRYRQGDDTDTDSNPPDSDTSDNCAGVYCYDPPQATCADLASVLSYSPGRSRLSRKAGTWAAWFETLRSSPTRLRIVPTQSPTLTLLGRRNSGALAVWAVDRLGFQGNSCNP